MKEIPLNHGKVALVDDEDFEAISAYTWCAVKRGRRSGTRQWYAVAYIGGGRKNPKQVLMHRLIAKGIRVDHWDRNGLNNQRSNLRPATGTQNNANSVKRTGLTSMFKGVSWDARRSKWMAQIMKLRRNFHLGRFTSEIEAANAYDRAAREHFGWFARLNFPSK